MNAQRDDGGKVAPFWRLPGLIILLFNASFLLYFCFRNFWWLVDTETEVLRGLLYGGFFELPWWPHLGIWLVCILVAVGWYFYYRKIIICFREILIIFKGGFIRIIERLTCFVIVIWMIVYVFINILAIFYVFY